MWNLKVLMSFLVMMSLVACGDDEKEKDKDDSATNGDGLSLKFADLANFVTTQKPKNFKVSVYKGDAVDDKSTLKIKVEIACGADHKASTEKDAVKGEASFTADDFGGNDGIDFTKLPKGTKCKASATADGATAGSKDFEPADEEGGDDAITVETNGLIKITSDGTVKLASCTNNATSLVKWTTDATAQTNPHTVEAAASFVMKKADANVYLSGDKAGCKVTLGTDDEADLSRYTAPAGDKAIMRGTLGADAQTSGFSPTWTGGGTKTFQWYAKKGSDDPLSGTLAQAQPTATKVEVNGMLNAHNNEWVIWVKNTDGIQKL